MAFLAALPEIGEAAGAAGEAAGAAGGGESGGLLNRAASLFKSKPEPMESDQAKQQNVGESRTFNFQDAANQARTAFRPSAGGGGGVD